MICRIDEHWLDTMNWHVPGWPRGVVHAVPRLRTLTRRVFTFGTFTLLPSKSTKDLTLGLVDEPPPNSIETFSAFDGLFGLLFGLLLGLLLGLFGRLLEGNLGRELLELLLLPPNDICERTPWQSSKKQQQTTGFMLRQLYKTEMVWVWGVILVCTLTQENPG